MAKKPLKGQYLTLEDVRIHFNKDDNKITLTSKDKDLKGRFNITLNQGSESEETLRTLMSDAGMEILPSALDYNTFIDQVEPIAPYTIPLGRALDQEVIWDLDKHQNLAVVGRAPHGKTALVYSILDYVNASDQKMQVAALCIGLDNKLISYNRVNTYAEKMYDSEPFHQRANEVDILLWENILNSDEEFFDGKTILFVDASNTNNEGYEMFLDLLYRKAAAKNIHIVFLQGSSQEVPEHIVASTGLRIHMGKPRRFDNETIPLMKDVAESVYKMSPTQGEGYFVSVIDYKMTSGRFALYLPVLHKPEHRAMAEARVGAWNDAVKRIANEKKEQHEIRIARKVAASQKIQAPPTSHAYNTVIDTVEQTAPYTIPLGETGNGQLVWDLNKDRHLMLIGGAGSGKTAMVRTILDYMKLSGQKWNAGGFNFGTSNNILPREEWFSYYPMAHQQINPEHLEKAVPKLMKQLDDKNFKVAGKMVIFVDCSDPAMVGEYTDFFHKIYSKTDGRIPDIENLHFVFIGYSAAYLPWLAFVESNLKIHMGKLDGKSVKNHKMLVGHEEEIRAMSGRKGEGFYVLHNEDTYEANRFTQYLPIAYRH